MNKKEIEKLREKLEENKKSLEETLLRFAKKDDNLKGNWDTIFPKVEGSSMEEKADEVEEYSSLLPIEHSLELKLKNINEALEKIKKKKYGACEKCNKKIPFQRLSVTPEIKTCKDCS
jgi:DnaK suppressor protein